MTTTLTVAMATHLGDKSLAVQLLKWIGSLGCCKSRTLVLILDEGSQSDMAVVLGHAQNAFGKLEVVPLKPCPWGKEWPRGANWAFMHAAEHLKGSTFLWMEPDSFPTRKDWLAELENEYNEAGMPYMGRIIEANEVNNHPRMLIGVAIYPPNTSEVVNTDIIKSYWQPWDTLCAGKIVPNAHNTALIQHFPKTPTGYAKLTKLSVIKPETVLFHGDKFGNLCRQLALKHLVSTVAIAQEPEIEVQEPTVLISKPVVTEADDECAVPNACKSGWHAGDRGDVVYALPLMRHMGITKLYLCPDGGTRERMTLASAKSLGALVREQPYMETCTFRNTPPEGAIDLNQFRRLLGPVYAGRYEYHNLSALQLRWFGFQEHHETERWLWVTPKVPANPVIIARSGRYNSNHFDWALVMKKYGDRAAFVGSHEEHAVFQSRFGTIQYQPTATLLELAQIIAGSELFIGNQSCPYAIAEGLKHPAILEWVPGPAQNCHFSRPGLVYGTENIKLTVLKAKPAVNWVALSDLHSGFGRMAHAFYIRSKEVDMHWVPTRTSSEFTQFDPSISLKQVRIKGNSVVLDSVPVIHEFIKPGDIALTMWESTRLPDAARDAINGCKAVITTTEWCKQVFVQSGVKPPVFKVPLGVDSVLYRPPDERRNNGKLVFGASTRFCSDGNPRKCIHEIVKGFKLAFPKEKDVRLQIKGYDSCGYVISDDKRVKVITDFWTDNDMVRWYQNLDGFINLARGGGWELHVHEAMLCGAVPVVLNFSSTLEFVDAMCGYLVDYKLVDCDWHVYKGCGQWANPNMDSYVETLRHIYNHRDELGTMRVKARRVTENLTWENASTIMDRTLLNIIQ